MCLCRTSFQLSQVDFSLPSINDTYCSGCLYLSYDDMVTCSHIVFPDDKVLHMLNEGHLKQLQSLQTIGPKRAQQIMTWRTLHGQFHKVGNKN